MLKTTLLLALTSATLFAGVAYGFSGKPDVYTDGSSVMGPRDPYTDGGFTGKPDVYTDGNRVTDRRDAFTDGS